MITTGVELIALAIIALAFGLVLFKPSINVTRHYVFLYYDWGTVRKEVIIKI